MFEMFDCRRRLKVNLKIIVFLIGITGLVSAPEAKPPDSINVIQQSVSDSVKLEGQVVYVDFWASWCLPCRKSFPWMKQIADEFSNRDFRVVTINLDKDLKAAEKFIKEQKVNLEVVFDPGGKLAELFELKAIPSSYIYGRDGVLRKVHEGFLNKDTEELEQFLSGILNEGAEK